MIVLSALLLIAGPSAGAEPSFKVPGCKAGYAMSGLFEDAAHGWTYFKEGVVEIIDNPDGSRLIVFERSPKRYLLAKKSDKAFLKFAKWSLKTHRQVHIAIETGVEKGPTQTTGAAGSVGRIRWLDRYKQHSSCG